MQPSPIPYDPAVAETLEIMRAAPRYSQWQYDRIAPYLGTRILELGAGVGTISAHMLDHEPELLVLTDSEAGFLTRLRERFGERRNVVVEQLTLPDRGAGERFGQYHLDTVVALNVLEHIEDDVGSLATVAQFLPPGGRLVLLVPALTALFGSLDRELGHFRRYSRSSLRRVMGAGGFDVERIFWFNRIGIAGWWLNAKILGATRIPVRQLRAFDRLVPLLRVEDRLPVPFGQSLIAVGRRRQAAPG